MTTPKPFIYHTSTKTFDLVGVVVIGRVAIPLVFPLSLSGLSAVVALFWGMGMASSTGDYSSLIPFYIIVGVVGGTYLTWLLIRCMKLAAKEAGLTR